MLNLAPGENCWRVERARRAAILIDNQSYYAALVKGLRKARRSILVLGWAFDPRTRLAPDGREGPDDPDEVGRILVELAQDRPELDVRLLIWRSTLSVNGSQDFLPHRAQRRFAGTRVRFRLDDTVPFGACHHQKVVVIDDELAFCGGGDIVTNRWDSRRHLDHDPRRILPDQDLHPPRHEVTMMVEGPAAAALGDLFRDRWRRATGEIMAVAERAGRPSWPGRAEPTLANVDVAIARTLPAWKGRSTVDECRRLTLVGIAGAQDAIYLESQYFTSPLIAAALAARLDEPDGPEVVLLVPGHAPNWFDQLTMDRIRNPMIRRLREADRFGRFRAYWPATSRGQAIVVHSKVSVIDDRILRVGSANLNNRSGGLDSECDLAIAGQNAAQRRTITAFRDHLVAHFLGVPPRALGNARKRAGSLGRAIDSLNHEGRLAPIEPARPTRLEALLTSRHIGDPLDADDNWKLHRREPSKAG